MPTRKTDKGSDTTRSKKKSVNRIQIINLKGMELEDLNANLRPVVACEISSQIPVQVINIEGLDVDRLGEALRLVVACEISST